MLDTVCAELLTDGPLAGQRLLLWWQVVGAYVGEVLVCAYGGEWILDPADAPAVKVRGVTAFPFSTVHRILTGEPFKSLASLGRALPALIERAERSD